MKRILFIAPHSYPIKSSESICNSKVAYMLAESGYKVDVYTCSDSSTYPADIVLDSKLRDSENLSIYTVTPDYIILRKEPLARIVRAVAYNTKILLQTGYFYNGISTTYLILQAIKKRIKEEGGLHYDAVITRGYNTDIAGIYLSKKYGLKWIANWNDPFPMKRFPAPYGEGFDAKLPYFENKIYLDIQKYASIHTFPNPRLRDYMLKCFTNVGKDQTVVIPHMALSTLSCQTTKDNSVLKLVHCGNAKKPRNPELFIKALAKVDYTKTHVYFVGGVDDAIKNLVNELGLTNNVTFINGMNYKDSTDFVSTCHISLIIEAQCDEGIYLPTKVVDSFQCGNPIFAISPECGVLKDMTSKYKVGYFANNESEDAIKNQLQQAISDFENNQLIEINKSIVPEVFEDEIINTYKQIL